jgi:uncharacterized protein (DUF2141 family)
LGDVPCEERPYSIIVTVTNVKESRGTITLDLHDDDPEKWLKKGFQVARIRVPATKGDTKMCVPILKPGVYAIALYHDRDGNRQFNKNFLGIPTEPFGISNNPSIGFNAPPLDDAAFEVKGPLTPITIKLR